MPLYELEEGTSRKYYRIELEGTRIETHWGRIGTEGTRKTIELPTTSAAEAEYHRQIERRYERGYRLVVDEDIPHNQAEERTKRSLTKVAPLNRVPRFLFVNKKKKRFVWIEADGSNVTVAEGLTGREADVVPQTATHASPAHAKRASDAAIAKLVGDGFELATFSDPDESKTTTKTKTNTKTITTERPKLTRNAELEAHVREAPYDEERWMVLEDWLLEQQDPRAEILRLEKDKSKGDATKERARHLELLFGPKASSLTKQLSMIDWRSGFVRECRFDVPKRNATAVFTELLRAPALSLVRSFELHLERQELELLTPPLLAQPSFAASVRRLALSFRGGAPRARDVLDRDFLSPFERLERLSLTNSARLPHDIKVLRTLEHLTYAPSSPDELGLLFLDGSFPSLREIDLDLRPLEALIPIRSPFETYRGSEAGGADRAPALRIDGIDSLTTGLATPKLEKLTLRWPRGPTLLTIIETLAPTALLRNLRAIDILSVEPSAATSATELLVGHERAFAHVHVVMDRLTR